MCTSAGCKILHLIKKAEKSGSSISYWFLNLVSNILTIIVDVHLKSYIEMSWVPIWECSVLGLSNNLALVNNSPLFKKLSAQIIDYLSSLFFDHWVKYFTDQLDTTSGLFRPSLSSNFKRIAWTRLCLKRWQILDTVVVPAIWELSKWERYSKHPLIRT